MRMNLTGWDPWRRCRDKTENQTRYRHSVCLPQSVCVCRRNQSFVCTALLHKWGENCTFGRIEFITDLFIALYAANRSRTEMEWGAQTCKTVVSMRFKLERDKWINFYSIRDHFLLGLSPWRSLIFSVCHSSPGIVCFIFLTSVHQN